ncbi:hypothetical protein ACWDTI_21470 [Gordonia sp. NPDC003424]
MSSNQFHLRLRSPELRELVREVAEHANISQNQLIEEAVAHEVLLRGATIASDLERAADRIAELSNAEYQRIVARSVAEYADGEGTPQLLQERMIRIDTAVDESAVDGLGVMAAFDSPQV